MGPLLKAIAVAALSLYPSVAANNYTVPSLSEQAYASSLPSGKNKKYVANISYPNPIQAKVDGREVLVYDFPLEDIAIDVLVSKKPQKYSLFVAEAKKKYGSKLEFMTSSTFYDGGIIGRIFKDGKLINKKKYSLGVDLAYSDKYDSIEFIANSREIPDYVDTVVGGLAALVKDTKVVTDFSNRRIRNDRVRERIAIGVKRGWAGMIVCTTSKVKDLAEIMDKLGCLSAAAPDGGGSRMFYHKGKILKKPTEKIASVIVGYRK